MNRISIILAQVTLAITLIVAGLVVCVVPNFPTTLMTGWYAADEDSPYTKEELVTMAVYTKDYTFFNQDRTDLFASMVRVQNHAAEEGRMGEGAPVITAGDEASVAAAFDAADPSYVIQTDALAHLDDVSKVVKIVFVVGFLALCVAAGVILDAYFTHMRSALPKILVGGGAITAVIMLAFGVWGYFGFDSFFNVMHSVLFADGTWTFPADSLLITMFPAAFWQGMGVLWVGVSVILGVVSILLGKSLVK